MIGTSPFAYAFIRICIFLLRSVLPLSFSYCLYVLLVTPNKFRLPWPVELWAVAEVLFYAFIYLPRKYILQHAASHPSTPDRQGRQALFERCHNSIQDPEKYLAIWFQKAPRAEIKRDNVKEFFCWAFFNKNGPDPGDEEELESYVLELEEMLGRKLEHGKGRATSLRHTLEPVDMLHRPLLWYTLCVFVVDTITHVYMLYHSFHLHRLPLGRFFTIFPLRPLTLISTHKSPVPTLSYWHRPHTSKTKLPILFIHGIGIGLYPYVNFLAELNRTQRTSSIPSDVGIIALEIMPISFRITSPSLEKAALLTEIHRILTHHNWSKVLLISHSYGSVISTHLLHSRLLSPFIGPVVLIDPVSFLLHLPDVAYNFTRRKPRRANEWQLYYFASTDMGVAHTLARRFFWSENILWKEDIANRQITVSLGGKDLIVDTESVGRYLSRRDDFGTKGDAWKRQEWRGEGMDVLWFGELDHAQVFDSRDRRRLLVDVVRAYNDKVH